MTNGKKWIEMFHCALRKNELYSEGNAGTIIEWSAKKMFFMKNTASVGQIGEGIACAYLAAHHFRIHERNFRRSWGEIDIIATDPKGILVFIEVKTIVRHGDGSALLPEDNLTRYKIQKMKRIAEFYANSYQDAWKKQKGWRIDAVALSIPEDKISPEITSERELTKLMNYCEINYFENVE